jgi:hypothetical protein
MRAIFISYRRDDTEGQAGHLFNDLARSFGKDAVFMDVAAIEPGRDFRRVIDDHVASCGVLLTLLGRGWLNATNEAGQRRLDDPMDFVRLETAAALKRDIPVVPVLVHGAKMPRADELPDELKELAFRNSVELTHARWDSDMEVLIKALRPYVQAQPGPATPAAEPLQRPANQEPARKTTSSVGTYAVVGTALLLSSGALIWFGQTPRKATDVAATAVTAATTPPQMAQASAPGATPIITAPGTVASAIKKPVLKPPPPKPVIPQPSPPAATKTDVNPQPIPVPIAEPLPVAKPALAPKDWEGVWQLRFQYAGNWSDDKTMKVRAGANRVSGSYDIGNFSGAFSGNDHSRISGEFVNTAGTGVDCPNGKQGVRFTFTLSEDAKTMSGWWDVCGQGPKWPWKAARY